MSRNIILTKGNLQALADKIRALLFHSLIDRYMPVGYVWATSKAPDNGGNPNLLYPGTTWVRIKDAYLCAAGDNVTVDSDPEHDTPHGSNTRTAANVPKHTHGITMNEGTESSPNYTANMTMRSVFSSGRLDPIFYKGDENFSQSGAGIYISTSYGTGSAFYGKHYGSNDNTKWFTLNVTFPSHTHSIPAYTEYSEDGSITTMDIQPKRFYKYVWERTA